MINQSDLVRKASHAGSWYSGDGKKLNEQLDNWLGKAQKEIEGKKIKALIGPHAGNLISIIILKGYTYSGPTAAWAYNYIEPIKNSKVFVLGPSHHEYIAGCGLSSSSSCSTPFGDIPIDTEIINELKATGKFKMLSLHTDEQEHSLEMHFPFIHKQFSKMPFSMIPIMVGQVDSAAQEEYSKILAPYWKQENVFFVISSDFCHCYLLKHFQQSIQGGDNFDYQPYDKSCGEIYQYIEKLDKQGANYIENQDGKGFNDYLKSTQNTICGRTPISILLNTIKLSQMKVKTKLVQYAQSSRLTKDGKNGSSSVSYAAFITYLE